MEKLTPKEAAEARQRGLDYEHSMAIEGVELTPNEKLIFERIDRERMGYEEGIRFVTEWCLREGLIQENCETAE